jgi:hypothetical protein
MERVLLWEEGQIETNERCIPFVLKTPGYLSSEPPRKRNAPEERQHQSLRDEDNFQKWISDDKVNSFDTFCLKLLHEENAATSHASDHVCIPFIGLYIGLYIGLNKKYESHITSLNRIAKLLFSSFRSAVPLSGFTKCGARSRPKLALINLIRGPWFWEHTDNTGPSLNYMGRLSSRF